MEIIASIHIQELMASVFDAAQRRKILKLAPVLADNSLHAPVAPNQHLGRNTPSLKGRRPMLSRLRHQRLRTRKGKGKSKGQNKKTKPSAKSGDVDFHETAQDEQEEPDEPAEEQEDDAEVYLAVSKRVHLLQLHARLLQSLRKTLGDTWEGSGGVLVVLQEYIDNAEGVSTLLHGEHLARTYGPASEDCPVEVTAVMENVKSVDLLCPRKVAYSWTGLRRVHHVHT